MSDDQMIETIAGTAFAALVIWLAIRIINSRGKWTLTLSAGAAFAIMVVLTYAIRLLQKLSGAG